MEQTALLERHRASGAVLGPPELGLSPLHYGDPEREYRAATTGAALVDDSARGRLRAEGPDALVLLHRILANDVRSLAVGDSQRNLLLSAKGKVLEDVELVRLEPETLWLTTEPGRAAPLMAELERYVFSERLTLSDTSPEYAPLTLLGPGAGEILANALALRPPTAPRRWHAARSRSGVQLFVEPCPIAGRTGWRLHVDRTGVEALWTELLAAHATPTGELVRECLRIEAGRARFGRDLGPDCYPQEAGITDGFSLSKGCYVGQEVVAKLDTYGGLNRRLVGLAFEDAAPVAAETRLVRPADGAEVGRVTAWTHSPRLGRGLALAYVKVAASPPGTVLRLATDARLAAVVELPLARPEDAR